MVIRVDRAEWFIAEGKTLITDYPSDKYSKKGCKCRVTDSEQKNMSVEASRT
tara:strand:- start:241 stop:396 length:156 start_codon:yes stop_codon:yes gene_type:complete